MSGNDSYLRHLPFVKLQSQKAPSGSGSHYSTPPAQMPGASSSSGYPVILPVGGPGTSYMNFELPKDFVDGTFNVQQKGYASSKATNGRRTY